MKPFYLLLFVLLCGAPRVEAQSALGKHPKDKFISDFWETALGNTNANSVVWGLNRFGTEPITNESVLSGFMRPANNLSEVADVDIARERLGAVGQFNSLVTNLNLWGDTTISGNVVMDQGDQNLRVSPSFFIGSGSTFWDFRDADAEPSAFTVARLGDVDAKADAVHVHAAADVTSGTLATARLGSGTASSATYLRGDGTWATVPAAGLLPANNLNDVSNAGTARINLGALAATNGTGNGLTNLGWFTLKTNAAFPVGGIKMENNTQILLGDGGSEFWNEDHPGGGEYQITSDGSMSLNVGYDGLGGRVLQIGSTGGTHEYLNNQYDCTVDSLHPLGFSKLYRWISTAWNGSGTTYHAIATRAEARDQSGFNSELVFWNPSPSWSPGYNWAATLSGGSRMGALQTNGWELNGRIAKQLQTASPGASTYAIDFNAADNKVVNISQATAFTISNLYLTNQAQRVFLNIYPGLSGWTISFPTDANGVRWIWRNADGTATAPTSIAGSKAMFVELLATVNSAFTNIIANYTLGSYSPSVDADAAAFFTAASITDGTQKAAVNQLVLDLKAHSLWTKVDALYPFVGGDATKHSFNLKNPATFQITWAGTVIHNANGITGNGTNGWGDTGYIPLTHGQLDSAHVYVYNRTTLPTGATASPMFMQTVGSTGGTSRYGLGVSGSALNVVGLNNNDTGSLLGVSSDFRGSLMGSRTGPTTQAVYANAGAAAGSTTATSVRASYSLGILARNFQGFSADNFSNANLAAASAGPGMTAAEKTQYFADILALQTTLGRQ